MSPPEPGSAISVLVDGRTVQFDQPPILENGRTLVPVRAVSEAFGCNVDRIQNTQTVVISQ